MLNIRVREGRGGAKAVESDGALGHQRGAVPAVAVARWRVSKVLGGVEESPETPAIVDTPGPSTYSRGAIQRLATLDQLSSGAATVTCSMWLEAQSRVCYSNAMVVSRMVAAIQ